MNKRAVYSSCLVALFMAMLIAAAFKIDSQDAEIKRLNAELADALTSRDRSTQAFAACAQAFAACDSIARKQSEFLREVLFGAPIPPRTLITCSMVPPPEAQPSPTTGGVQ